MSRFYVGQRVRIVAATVSKSLIGRETTVVAIDVDGWCMAFGNYRGIETSETANSGRSFIALSHQLEPIADCYDIATWDNCVWQPEHLRSEA